MGAHYLIGKWIQNTRENQQIMRGLCRSAKWNSLMRIVEWWFVFKHWIQERMYEWSVNNIQGWNLWGELDQISTEGWETLGEHFNPFIVFDQTVHSEQHWGILGKQWTEIWHNYDRLPHVTRITADSNRASELTPGCPSTWFLSKWNT